MPFLSYIQNDLDGGATWRPTLEPLTRMCFQWHIIHSGEYFITRRMKKECHIHLG